MYSVCHSNIFIMLMATSFGNNGHHQANVTQKLEKAVACNAVYMGSHLHYINIH